MLSYYELYYELLKAYELACQWIANDHKGTAEDFQDYFLKRAKEVDHEKATSEEMGETEDKNLSER